MSETIADLRAMSDDQLIDNHDRHASGTVVGTRHYLDELRHRDAARSEQRMIALTAQIRTLTWIIAILRWRMWCSSPGRS